jgi:hypothetical protein
MIGMQKIPLLFKTDEQRKYVIPQVNVSAVFKETTIAHRKYDGTCLMLDDEGWWARRQIKLFDKTPEGFQLVEVDHNTNKGFGWEPLSKSPFHKFWQEAHELHPLDCDYLDMRDGEYENGTYELIGPKINGNPEKLKWHRLVPHNRAEQLGDIQMLELHLVQDPEQAYAELKRVLFYLPVEGVVFKDRNLKPLAKLRRKDFDFAEEERAKLIQESIERKRETVSKMLDGSDHDWKAGTV